MNRTVRIELAIALERGEFRLEYQPKVSQQAGRVIGLEALVRWQHPERGTLLPRDFIQAAEASNLIVPLGDWVLRTACAQNKAWQDQGLVPVQVSVNVSARQLCQSNFAQQVRGVLSETGLEPKYLQFELVDYTPIEDTQSVIEVLRELRTIGVEFATDNFGVGHSSLSRLRLPLQVLKINRYFIEGLPNDEGRVGVVHAVIRLAHTLDVKVAAIGVETEAQCTYLRAQGCDQMQGYLFSHPLPPNEVGELLGQPVLAPRLTH